MDRSAVVANISYIFKIFESKCQYQCGDRVLATRTLLARTLGRTQRAQIARCSSDFILVATTASR